MATQTGPSWTLKGDVLIACNCDYGCPCNFNALPTQGHSEGAWAWYIREGTYGDTDLSGLTVSIAADWPNAIHQATARRPSSSTSGRTNGSARRCVRWRRVAAAARGAS